MEIQLKKALITGASGFLGSYAAKELYNSGYEIYAIDINDYQACSKLTEIKLNKWIKGPVSAVNLSKFSARFDTIIHCAGSGAVGYSFQSPADDFNISVNSLLETLEYARNTCPEASIVYPSSAAVYGLVDDTPIKESVINKPYSPYGYHKQAAELLARSYSEYFSLNISVVRFFSLYGDGLKKQFLWDASKKIISHHGPITFFGTGLETRDWFHAKDAARLMRILAEQANRFVIVNGANGIRTEMREIALQLSACFENNPEIEFNGHSRPGDPKYYNADTERLQSIYPGPYLDIRQGIKAYANWFKQNYKTEE